MRRLTFVVVLLVGIMGMYSGCKGNDASDGQNPSDSSQLAQDPVTLKYLTWLDQGKAAMPELLTAVKDENWRMRSHAALALGKTGEKSAVSVLIGLLKNDPQIAVKNCAVISLGELQAKEAVPLLIEQLSAKTKPGVPRLDLTLVVETLGKIKDVRAITPLYKMLYDPDDITAVKSMQALILIGDKSISTQILRDMARIKKEKRERYAAEIFGELPVPGAEDALLGFLKTDYIPVLLVSADSLGKLKSVRAVLPLVSLLAKPDAMMQQRTAAALVLINSPIAINPLVALFVSPVKGTPLSAAYVLSEIKSPVVAPTVFDVFTKNEAVNAPAAYVLGRKKFAAAAPLMVTRLKNTKLSGHDEMAEALGLMNYRTAIPFLIEIAQRSSYQGSVGAVMALGAMKAKEAVPVLIKLLKSKNTQLAVTAIGSLGDIGDQRAVKPIIRLVYESGDDYILYVGPSLGAIGGPDVVAFVKDNITNPNKLYMRAAGLAMIGMKSPALIDYEIKLLDGTGDSVKYAIQALQTTTGLKFTTAAEWKKWAKSRK